MAAILAFASRFIGLIPGLISAGQNIAELVTWAKGVIDGSQSGDGTISDADWQKLDELEQAASDAFDEAAKPSE